MRRLYYILDERGEPVPCPDLLTWARWFEVVHHRILTSTDVGAFHVSTVFLGIDHAFHGGPPVLWETMIFGAPKGHPLDGYQERYTSRGEAIEGHARAVAAAEGAP